MRDYKNSVLAQKTAATLIKRAKERKYRKNASFIMNAGLLGTYGFYVCIPVFAGLVFGKWVDSVIPLPPISWTLNFVLLGFLTGILVANRWLSREGVVNNMKAKHKERILVRNQK